MSNIEYKPAEKLTIHLSRPDYKFPWGFRLQGGIDFSTPLSIQSVNPNSVSEQWGLKPGDAILSINNRTSDAMMHDDAKDEIMKSGNHITMLVQRGAVKIWKPQVTPMSELRPQELRQITAATGEYVTPVQKTSLAINRPPDGPCTIGSSHNRAAQPFGKPKTAVPNVVHAQYNSPMGLYSANNIADSFAKQTVGIQNQMQSLDIEDAKVGARMTSTMQSLDPSKMHQSPFGTSFSGPQSPGAQSPADVFMPQFQDYFCSMDLNEAPLSTVPSEAGQLLEREVPALDPSGIEPLKSSTVDPACMQTTDSTNYIPPTTFLSSPTAPPSAAATNFRPASPFKPIPPASPPTSLPASGSAFSAFSANTTATGFRPVSPFKPNAATSPTSSTSLHASSTAASPTSVPGYRSVSPFQSDNTISTATKPATLTASGTNASTAAVPGYRPVSPFLPNPNSATATALNKTPTAYGHDDSDSTVPVMQSRTFQKVQQQLEPGDEGEDESNNNDKSSSSSNVNIRGFKSVSAPVAKPPSERPQQPSMRCGGCDNLATGVIVKASGVPYHVACFKCASCSMNLKQKGFFRVNGQLFCETHAKRHAQPPPGSDMVSTATYR